MQRDCSDSQDGSGPLRLAPKAPKADYALLRSRIWLYVCVMTAAEIIEQIKALPPEEQALVAEFINRMRHEAASAALRDQPATGHTVHYVDDKVFRAAAERVFTQHAELLAKLAK